jgi:hypothetical protein
MYVSPGVKSADGFKVATVLPELRVTVAGTVAPPLVCSMKDEATLVGFIASLNVATTLEEAATPMASADGLVDTTVGRVVSGAVPATVNDHVLGKARLLPAASSAAVDMVAVYSVPAARFALGFRVATVLPELRVTVAGTGVPVLVCTSVKVDAVTLEGFIASLNVATTLEVEPTPVAPAVGTVDTTVGAVVSGPETPWILISLMLAQLFWLLPLTVTLTYWAFTSAKL